MTVSVTTKRASQFVHGLFGSSRVGSLAKFRLASPIFLESTPASPFPSSVKISIRGTPAALPASPDTLRSVTPETFHRADAVWANAPCDALRTAFPITRTGKTTAPSTKPSG